VSLHSEGRFIAEATRNSMFWGAEVGKSRDSMSTATIRIEGSKVFAKSKIQNPTSRRKNIRCMSDDLLGPAPISKTWSLSFKLTGASNVRFPKIFEVICWSESLFRSLSDSYIEDKFDLTSAVPGRRPGVRFWIQDMHGIHGRCALSVLHVPPVSL
jgi:hypothetical protein